MSIQKASRPVTPATMPTTAPTTSPAFPRTERFGPAGSSDEVGHGGFGAPGLLETSNFALASAGSSENSAINEQLMASNDKPKPKVTVDPKKEVKPVPKVPKVPKGSGQFSTSSSDDVAERPPAPGGSVVRFGTRSTRS